MTRPDTMRPLTAGRLLQIWREISASEKNELIHGLLCNARVLQESCFLDGKPLFNSAQAVLDALTVEEMEELLAVLFRPKYQTMTGSNPHFDEARFYAMQEGQA